MSDLPELSDLHRHLDGSLRFNTFVAFAQEMGLPLPKNIRFYKGMGLDKALESFRLTLAVLQTPEAVRRVAAEICEDAEDEGVTTLEIRFAPQLHRGAPMNDIVDAAIEGIDGRAGLIFCGLYGESPTVLERLVECAEPRKGVVGIDLAGGPQTSHRWNLEDYVDAFTQAKTYGIGRTVHAGEGRPPDEIRTAIEKLHAQRIGHGVTLLDDFDVVNLVIEQDVTIEACPTSNVHTGIIEDITDHPLPLWLDAGIQACVCTDNTLFSKVDSPTELLNVAEIPGMDHDLLDVAIQYGHAAAFTRS
jgi:adenosine deaminase